MSEDCKPSVIPLSLPATTKFVLFCSEDKAQTVFKTTMRVSISIESYVSKDLNPWCKILNTQKCQGRSWYTYIWDITNSIVLLSSMQKHTELRSEGVRAHHNVRVYKTACAGALLWGWWYAHGTKTYVVRYIDFGFDILLCNLRHECVELPNMKMSHTKIRNERVWLKNIW